MPPAATRPERTNPPPRLLQFSLLQLTAFITVAAVLCFLWFRGGVFRVGLLWLFFGGLSFAGYLLWQGKWNAFAPIGGLLCFMVGGCQIMGVLVRIADNQPRTSCSHNLKQIAIALHNYHDTHGSFPPAYLADDQGRPMHSWRVLILPFLEQQQLYDQYRFDEPWDGPHNRLLADEMPRIYRCPSEVRVESEANIPSYLAVVGPDTVWPGAKGVPMSAVVDPQNQTLLLVESYQSGINWLEPRDLSTIQMARKINPEHGQGICSCHPQGAYVAMVDGSIRYLDAKDVSPSILEALLTIDGGEPERFEDSR